jgi:aspartate/methionine/tyrosine aminotransferase
MTTYDFSWGEPFAVRDALKDLGGLLAIADVSPLDGLEYPAHEGETEYLKAVSDLIEATTGVRYPHVLATAGCTQALVAALRSFPGRPAAIPERRFSLYPDIVAAAGKTFIEYQSSESVPPEFAVVVDSPSNPDGWLRETESSDFVIWDAAYHSPTFGVAALETPSHAVMCGSLGKTLGLPGLRLGWLATGDQGLFERAASYVTASTLGAGKRDQITATAVLKSLDLQLFFKRSRAAIDANRERFARLRHIFGTPGDRGMFHVCDADGAALKILARVGARVQPGNRWGGKTSEVRFSLGQKQDVTQAFVTAVLDADTRKGKKK